MKEKSKIPSFLRSIKILIISILLIFISFGIINFYFYIKTSSHKYYYEKYKFGYINNKVVCGIFECKNIINDGVIYKFNENNIIVYSGKYKGKLYHIFNNIYVNKYLHIYLKYDNYYIYSDILDTDKLLINFIVSMLILTLAILSILNIEKKEEKLNIEKNLKMMQHNLSSETIAALTENLHHELNTPIDVIRINLSLGQNTVKNLCNEDCNYKNLIHNNINTSLLALEQISNIIDKISNYKHIKFSNGDKSIYDIIKSSIDSILVVGLIKFDYKIDNEFKKFKINHETGLNNGDLMGICINHIKNSTEAKASMVEFKFISFKNNFLTFHIKDNGIGIKNETIDKIYNPEFSTKKSNGKNTGNGMYINKIILNDVGGNEKIFYSEVNKGAIIEITIPVLKTL